MNRLRSRPLLHSGFTVAELIAILIITALITIAVTPKALEVIERSKLETATSRLVTRLTKAMRKADETNQSCGLGLSSEGFTAPADNSIKPCLYDGDGAINNTPGVSLGASITHSLPPTLIVNPSSGSQRFSKGGLVVLSSREEAIKRCIVLSPWLGQIAVGRYIGTAANEISEAQCIAEPAS